MGKFFGQYERTLDEKNRLQIPSRLLSDLPKSFYALRGFDGCLAIYEEASFHSLQEEWGRLSLYKPESRAFLRLSSASVVELALDSHGRISLGTDLAARYHIGPKVVVLGLIDHFEIWDEAAYREYEAKNSEQFERLASTLEAAK